MNRMSVNRLAIACLCAASCLLFLALNIYAQPAPGATGQENGAVDPENGQAGPENTKTDRVKRGERVRVILGERVEDGETAEKKPEQPEPALNVSDETDDPDGVEERIQPESVSDSGSRVAEAEAVESTMQPEPVLNSVGEVEGASGYTPEYQPAQAVDYEAHAQIFRQLCASPQTGGSVPFPASVVELDSFFIIQGKAGWLPPRPANPDETIEGVDADRDCVRDDIEYYIAEKYPRKDQYQLRKYLYEYAVWLRWFLLPNISEITAKTASNFMAAAGVCVGRIIGDTAARGALDDLFAQFHNTFPRSYRYLDNLSPLGGWTTRRKISVSCP